MQYLGGKTRIAKQLAAVINPIRGGRPVWDAFCGGLSMSAALGGEVYASDGNLALISTYKAVATGWDPPSVVTEDEYEAARALSDEDPHKAFVAIGCSFGGKWFGGYARAHDPADKRTTVGFAAGARKSLLRVCPGRNFFWIDFLRVTPRPWPSVLYLDPPYAGATDYAGCPPFDHNLFYRRVVEWSKHTDVFVSEYSMPDLPNGRVMWEAVVRTSMDGRGAVGKARERLYHYRIAS